MADNEDIRPWIHIGEAAPKVDKLATLAKANALISERKHWQAENLLVEEGILKSKDTDTILARMCSRLGEAYDIYFPATNGHDRTKAKTRSGDTFLNQCMSIYKQHPNASPSSVCEQVGCSIWQAARAKKRFDYERERSQR